MPSLTSGTYIIVETTDLTPLFNWNTKQLFLYLEAEYTDGKGVSFQPTPLVLHMCKTSIDHVPGN